MIVKAAGLLGLISIHALHEESDIVLSHQIIKITISIHALHEESDQYAQQSADWGYQFQSTLSMRRATQPSATPTSNTIFQSTLSMRRAT